MNSARSLDQCLASMRVTRHGDYAFCTFTQLPAAATPFAVINEDEFATAVVPVEQAKLFSGMKEPAPFTRITIEVATSLVAGDLTTAVTQQLTARSIPVNLIAGFHQDHIFVPAERAVEAITTLEEIATQARGWLPN